MLKFCINSLLVLFFLSTSLLASPQCKIKSFNIKTNNEITILEVLTGITDLCNLTIIATDKFTKTKLNSKLLNVNIKNSTLSEALDILLTKNDLFYTLNTHTIEISSMRTKSFKIDYITSVREGYTATRATVDLTPSRNDDNNSDQDLKSDNTITSAEKFDFWANLSQELNAILNNGANEIISPQPVINKNAAIVTVTGSPSQLKRVEKYINNLKNRLNKQVMIDVTILSVELLDTYTKGVDWSKFKIGFNSYLDNSAVPSTVAFGNKGFSLSQNSSNNLQSWSWNPGELTSGLKNIVGGFVVGGRLNLQLDGVINFLEQNGKTRVVSNPKIMTLNNQPAIISVGDTVNYVLNDSIKDTTNSVRDLNSILIKQKPYSIFVGILLNILPEISDDGKIMLRINPTLSDFKYPGDLNLKTQPDRKLAPDTRQRKLSTVVRVNSGDTIIIGGLIGQSNSNTQNYVPILSEIPLLGNLFKSDAKTQLRNELVFIIKPKIVELENFTIKESLEHLGYTDIKHD